MKQNIILATGLLMAVAAVPLLAHEEGAGKRGAMAARMGEPVTKAAMESRVKERFAKADANGDGFITEAEIGAAQAKRVADRQNQHFATLDANKDGAISRAEFDAGHADRAAMRGQNGPRAGMMRRHRTGMGHGMGHGAGEAAGGAMLLRADANKDGKVSLSEAMAKPMERFISADANKDGTLTPEERKAARQDRRMERGAKRM